MVFATFVIFQFPLNDSFIAAVLTILGYSINDTIVIYDRIRENERLYGKKITRRELVNKSINQSLTRTINTTVATVLRWLLCAWSPLCASGIHRHICIPHVCGYDFGRVFFHLLNRPHVGFVAGI